MSMNNVVYFQKQYEEYIERMYPQWKEKIIYKQQVKQIWHNPLNGHLLLQLYLIIRK